MLQKLYQPLLNWRQCAAAWQGVGWPVTENHVCVGDLRSQKGVCSGDSGRRVMQSFDFQRFIFDLLPHSGGPVQCRLDNGGKCTLVHMNIRYSRSLFFVVMYPNRMDASGYHFVDYVGVYRFWLCGCLYASLLLS